jgi:uncharacterized protein DUF4129
VRNDQEDEVRPPRHMAFDPSRFGSGARLRLLGAAAGAAILIALVVLASRPVMLSEGAADVRPGPAVALVHIVEIVGIALELLAILVLIVVLRSGRRRPPPDETQEYHEPIPTPWWLKAIVTALPLVIIGAIVYAIMHARAGAPPAQQLLLVPPPPSEPNSGAPVESAFGLGWWEYATAAAMAGIVFALVMRAGRPPAPARRAETEPSERILVLTRAVGASLRDAREERDPRRAVIAAYATMERELAQHGLPRDEAEAPLEYMHRLFGELDVGQDAIRTLTRLFEIARFSHHQIAPAAKAQAILALVALQEAVRSSP